MPRHSVRNGIFVLIGLLILAALFLSFFRAASDHKSMPFSDVVQAGRSGNLQSIVVHGTRLDVRLKNDSTEYRSAIADQTDLPQVLEDNGITIGGSSPNAVSLKYGSSRSLTPALWPIIGLLIVLVFVFYAGRWSNRTGSG
jgi:hypothetical protein